MGSDGGRGDRRLIVRARGWITVGIVGLLVAGAAGWAVQSGAVRVNGFGAGGTGGPGVASSGPFAGERALQVRMDTVASGPLVRTVSAPGTVEPRTKVQVSAQVLAKITALPFREGERVAKGDVLVRLDGRDLVAALESAQAGLRGQEANLKGAQADEVQARLDLERTRGLFPRDVTKAQLEAAEAALLRAEARTLASVQTIEQARASITRARKDLENTTITSPIDGVIVKLNAEVGETVVVGTLNNASSVIMEVADLADMLMKARVDEANIAPVVAGQRALVTIAAYRDRQIVGRVERVGLKQQLFRDGTSYFEVEIALDKPKELTLGSGLTSSADIEVQTFADAVKVPSQAVLDRRLDELPKEVSQDPIVDRNKTVTRVVFVVGPDGLALARPVRIGASDLTHTQVLAGLAAGDRIVVGPFRALGELKHELPVIEEGTKDAEGNTLGRKPGEGTGGGIRFSGPGGGPR
jgi:HlyD family secretion protein